MLLKRSIIYLPNHYVQLQIQYKKLQEYLEINNTTKMLNPFPLYAAVKLYSSTRSKTLVNWLCYCAGISLPYKSLLKLSRDIANRMIFQYSRDRAFRTLRKGILTIITNDNINQNSVSTTATRHYQGTSLTIFQFPTEENPGIPVEYGDLENPSNLSFLKIDAIPSSYSCIKTSLLRCKH